MCIEEMNRLVFESNVATVVNNDINFSSGIGKAFELTVLYILKKIGELNKSLRELPFIFNYSGDLPQWMSTTFEIKNLFSSRHIQEDYFFLNSFIEHEDNLSTLINAANRTGPDGMLLLKYNENSDEKHYVLFLIGVKYSMSTISNDVHKKNDKSILLENLFQKNEDRVDSEDSSRSNCYIFTKETCSENASRLNENSIASQYTNLLLNQLKAKVHLFRLLIEFDTSDKESETNISRDTNTITSFISASGFLKLLSDTISFLPEKSEKSEFKNVLNDFQSKLRNVLIFSVCLLLLFIVL